MFALLGATYADEVTVDMYDKNGKEFGEIKIIDTAQGVLLTGELKGLPPGAHGFHIHEGSKCTPPDFESAGGHFNPFNHKHGFLENKEYHLGDLPNIIVNSTGDVAFSTLAVGATLEPGKNSINNRTLIIHEDPDDYVSQPSGNAGARILCGEIKS